MTAVNPLAAERERVKVEAFVEGLRRIADLIDRGELPLPSTTTSLSWYPHGTDQREQAAKVAATLGGEWQLDGPSSGDYLHTSTVLAGGSYGGGIKAHLAIEHKLPPTTPPGEAFVAELNAAVRGDQQARIAAQGEPITREQALAALGGRDDDYSPEGIDRDTAGEATP